MGVEFEISIKSDDDDATENPKKVVIRAIEKVLETLKANKDETCEGRLNDINGNKIGTYFYAEEPSEEKDDDEEENEEPEDDADDD